MKSRIFFSILLCEALILVGLFSWGHLTVQNRAPEIRAKQHLVKQLTLTDYAVWTEARYTRHPSQADLFTPFQDFPASVEHFPAGSILALPDIIKTSGTITFSTD